MAAGWIEKLTGSLEQKKQYKQYKARLEALPGDYRVAARALDRYVMYAGGIADGEVMMRMFGDLADLFEEHAAAGTPIRDIVGTTRWSSPRSSSRTTRTGAGSTGRRTA